MIIAIASGKGGTGKTTLAVNLASSFAGEVQLLDCDVEEPNCHLFLRAEVRRTEPVTVPVPSVVAESCTTCGVCAEVCRFNAIAVLARGVLLFPELCHSCGGCARVCPEGAIVETERTIGVIEEMCAGSVSLVQGRLNVGEAKSPPVIRAVKARARRSGVVLLDAPPGTSCPMVAAVRGCDAAVLVTEPTPFGLHDLTLAVETVRALGVPFGVVLNRDGEGDSRVDSYCAAQQIPILARFPADRRIAEAYAKGRLICEAVPETVPLFQALAKRVLALAESGCEEGAA